MRVRAVINPLTLSVSLPIIGFMNAINHLLTLADRYRGLTGLGQSALSWRVFGDTKKLKALHDGADIQVKRSEKAMQWFSDHWPVDADWPAAVPRPATTPTATEAA